MTGLLGVLLALVPSLTVLAEPSLPAAIAAVALAVLCAGARDRGVVAAPARVHLARPSSYDRQPRQRGRATDPVHHPLRPRAPGLA